MEPARVDARHEEEVVPGLDLEDRPGHLVAEVRHDALQRLDGAGEVERQRAHDSVDAEDDPTRVGVAVGELGRLVGERESSLGVRTTAGTAGDGTVRRFDGQRAGCSLGLAGGQGLQDVSRVEQRRRQWIGV